MADHVPLDIRGKLLPLGIHLLRAVLAEKALPGVISLPDHLCRVGFGYSYQPDSGRKRRFQFC